MKKQATVFLVLAMFIFSMAACSNTKDSEDSTAATESTTKKTVLAGRTILGINEAGTYEEGHTQVTVLNFQESLGNEYDKPVKGNEFLIVTVEIKNTGKDDLYYYASNFKILRSKNTITAQTSSQINSDSKLSAEGILKANKTVSGTLIYEIPEKDNKNLCLLYYGSYLSEPTIIFDLNQTAL